MNEKIKNGLLWGFVVFCALASIAFTPSVATVIFLLVAVAAMPVKPIRNLWNKVPVKKFKVAILAVLFFVGIMTAPATETVNEPQNETIISEYETKNESITQATTQAITQAIQKVTEITTEQQAEAIEDQNAVEDVEADSSAVSIIVNSEVTSGVDNVDIVSDSISYNGQPYVSVNNNEPGFTDAEKKNTSAFENYSSLDSLGRCGVAYANICKEIMPTEERGNIGSVKPSGWHTVKYDCVDGKYLYNRCHLIGFQLAGENANKKNLITGTRYMNVDGMLPFENMVADYVKETNNHVLYRVTPVYDGNNLVASGVQMEAWSVEDGGEGICFNVFCFNVQPGVDIDYATGDSKLGETTAPSVTIEEDKTQTVKEEIKQEEQPVVSNSDVKTWVLNTSSKKFHKPSCKKLPTKNRQDFEGTREEVINMDYEPCGICHP